MILLSIKGRTPSKKNSRKLFVVRGRIIIAPSTDYEKWHRVAMEQIPPLLRNRNIAKADVDMTIYSPDARKFDLSNKAESICDLLVDAGVLVDDNYTIIQNLTLRYGGIDRETPRVDIIIAEQ